MSQINLKSNFFFNPPLKIFHFFPHRPLFEEIEISEVAKTLWEAPFPVLAHDASPDPGPLFVYANNAALELFETDWDSLIGTPSTKSAEPVTEIQDDRASALSQVLEKGFIDDYEGERISFKGTKFKISRSTVFNVDAPSGERVGQAAVIRSWEFEDGRKGGEAAAEEAAAAAAAVALAAAEGPEPTAEELSAAEAAVTAQAGVVRDLKEVGGLKNSSEEVVAAVLMLMEKKAVLDALKAKVGGSEETA